LENLFAGNRIFFSLRGGNKKRSQGKKSNDLKFVGEFWRRVDINNGRPFPFNLFEPPTLATPRGHCALENRKSEKRAVLS